MNLGDVMRELGAASLKNHTWTTSVLNTLNAILPADTLLSEDSTGKQVLQALATLPDDERNRLLQSSVDIIQGTLTIATSSTDAPTEKNDSKSESFHQVVVKDLLTNPSKALMLFAAFAIVIASLVVMVIMSISYTKTGKTPDTNLFTTLIKALVDIINAFEQH